jgi:dipeptidyl aminopeptidase/acylaminoacyl peptidase
MYIFEANETSHPKLFQKIATEDMLNTAPLHITRDGKFLYMIDSTGQDTSALIQVNLVTREKKLIHVDPRADVNDLMVNPASKIVEAVSVQYLKKEWQIIDSAVASDISRLQKIDSGDIEIVSRTKSDDKWIVAFLKDDGPFKYYLYDRSNHTAKFLFVSDSAQENLPFAKMHPVKIKARDGLELVSYLTLPRWLDNGGGAPAAPVPMVLYVHGGPNARDAWGFNAAHQWLANRGYAVLSVNYRGSTGFGKGFINAGDGQWARAMQDDLEDAVAWAVDNKIARKDKVAIMGGSYGGYATLVGMTRTPDLFAAGIDIVGPSNLETLLKSIPPYWKPMVAHLNKIIGASVDTEEGLALLKERSPLTYAEKIKKPLLIVQGANDPRVKQAESDQIVAAMARHKIPVVYLLYPDEGHGLARPENRLSMYALSEVFLANFLGGDYIPHDNNFPGSRVEVKEGKEITWTKEVGK